MREPRAPPFLAAGLRSEQHRESAPNTFLRGLRCHGVRNVRRTSAAAPNSKLRRLPPTQAPRVQTRCGHHPRNFGVHFLFPLLFLAYGPAFYIPVCATFHVRVCVSTFASVPLLRSRLCPLATLRSAAAPSAFSSTATEGADAMKIERPWFLSQIFSTNVGAVCR